jgi:fermentation-respiration switch protein FrsA (DUF1100 family)
VGLAPVIVLVNGLDSTKEHTYSSGFWAELAARGISCLMLDQPGTGEALRLQEFIKFAADVNLDGVVENITVPFLIAHGASDRQIPLEYAHHSYDQAVNSPRRELRVFTPEEGATEHIGLDHLPYVSSFIADWVADTFSELPRCQPSRMSG